MQEAATAREERNSPIFHAIQQQQEEMNKAIARDRESMTLLFDYLY